MLRRKYIWLQYALSIFHHRLIFHSRPNEKSCKHRWKKLSFGFAVILLVFYYDMKNAGPLSDLYIYYMMIPTLQFWNEDMDPDFQVPSAPISLNEIPKYLPSDRLEGNVPYEDDVFNIVDEECFQKSAVFPHQTPGEKKEKLPNFKTILSWNNAFGSKNFGFGWGHEPFERACCKESRCFLTDNRSALPIERFDAILFHFRSLTLNRLPSKRSIYQRWIFFELEAPANSFQDPDVFRGIFNWTMTYRRDSDIWASYGAVFRSSKTRITHKLKPKQKLVAWFVSHCGTLSHREHYAAELQRYIQIDVYGWCGTKTCALKESTKDYVFLEKNYKFYLSFENAMCKDYITEKFFNILRYNVVPVVYGMGNYKEVAPPHSYIDILDFNNVEDLARYLIYLDQNTTAYEEYFRWKQHYAVLPDKFRVTSLGFCSLCERLHSDKEPKIYQSIRNWFVDKARCKRLRPKRWFEKLFNINIGYL